MNLKIIPVNPYSSEFVAEVECPKLAGDISNQCFEQIQNALVSYSVLIFRNQPLNDFQQLEFSKKFGKLEKATGDYMKLEERRLPMELNDISNLDENGDILNRLDPKLLFSLGNMLWHSDSSFKKIPAQYSILSARNIPSTKGKTEFADMRGAWRELDVSTKRKCIGLVTEHSLIYSRGILGFDEFSSDQLAGMKPVPQALVRRHPKTKRLSLYLSSHSGIIRGWSMPESRLFLIDLKEHATQKHLVYRHVWEKNDLVIWDNQSTMHRAKSYNIHQIRDLRRTTIAGKISSIKNMPLNFEAIEEQF